MTDLGFLPLDPSQEEAIRAAEAGGVLVLGAPGTGKTRVAVEVLVRRLLSDTSGGRHILLAPTRIAAGELRSLVTGILAGAGRGTHQGVEVMTPSAFAFGLVRARAAAAGEPLPTLLTGAQQDQMLAELLAGHAEGEGVPLQWPEGLARESMLIPAFRAELRDLLMRADEHALSPEELVELGNVQGRPEWVLGGQLWEEYLHVVQLGDSPAARGARFDSSSVIAEATWLLAEGFEAPISTVVVDDYQEASAGLARLLGLIASRGARLVLTADPDVAVQTFRGAQPQLVGRADSAGEVGGFGLPRVVLSTCHGQAPSLRTVTRELTERVPSAGVVQHRRAEAGSAEAAAELARAGLQAAPLTSAVFPSRSAEIAYVARSLREARVHHGLAWEDMAVIVRSAPLQRAFEEGLALQQVQVHRGDSAMVLRDEPAVRLLLDLVTCAAAPEEELVTSLLLTDLGGLDTVSLRRLRREVRRRIQSEEFAEGTSIGEALTELVSSVAGAASVEDVAARPGVQRVAAALAATRAALAAPGSTHETVLWAAWSSTGLAEQWRSEAIDRGSARADRALDAVIALFKSAEVTTERSGEQTALGFVEQIHAQALPADSLARQGQRPGGVSVLTPAQAAGRRWGHVFVCGLEESVWPNTRIRDTLFGAARLADQELGRIGLGTGSDPASERAAVLADEWRMFASAASRARGRLTVTAVKSEDTVPSAFHRVVTELTGKESPEEPPGRSRLDLRGFVGSLRALLDDPATDHGQSAVAARVLGILADAGEPGADPASWAGAAPAVDDRPYRPLDQPVSVSPSRVELAGQCPLRWALETAGGRRASSMEASLGTLIHSIAADFPQGSLTELRKALDERFGEIGLGEGWVAARERERAEGMVERLAAYIQKRESDGVTEVQVEAPVNQRVGDAVIRGSMDRVERGPSGTRIVDLKTGGTAVSKEKALTHAQLGIYQLAAQEAAAEGEASDGAELVYVGGSTQAPSERFQPPLEEGGGWARELLDDTVAVMRGSEFAAVINETCRNCPVRTSCPLQREGGRCGS